MLVCLQLKQETGLGKGEISRCTDKERNLPRWRAGSELADFFIDFSTGPHFHFQVKLIWIRLLSNLGLPE